jgi:hypothetical protein
MPATSFPAAVPLPDVPLGQLANALRAMVAAFAEHRNATEGEDGLYADVVNDAPRLARTVDGLVAEHGELGTAIASLVQAMECSEVNSDTLREDARRILGDLARHRQRDADLVYEAYAADIGGE